VCDRVVNWRTRFGKRKNTVIALSKSRFYFRHVVLRSTLNRPKVLDNATVGHVVYIYRRSHVAREILRRPGVGLHLFQILLKLFFFLRIIFVRSCLGRRRWRRHVGNTVGMVIKRFMDKSYALYRRGEEKSVKVEITGEP